MPHFGGWHYPGWMTVIDLHYNTPKVDGKVSWKHTYIMEKRQKLIIGLATAWSGGPAPPALNVPV